MANTLHAYSRLPEAAVADKEEKVFYRDLSSIHKHFSLLSLGSSLLKLRLRGPPNTIPQHSTKTLMIIPSRITCGDVLFDACFFLSRAEIDGLELTGSHWYSALRAVSSGLPLRPLFVVVKRSVSTENNVCSPCVKKDFRALV